MEHRIFLGNGLDLNKTYRTTEGNLVRKFPFTNDERWKDTYDIVHRIFYNQKKYKYKFSDGTQFRFPKILSFEERVATVEPLPFCVFYKNWTYKQQDYVLKVIQNIQHLKVDFCLVDPHFEQFAFLGNELYYLDYGSVSAPITNNIRHQQDVIKLVLPNHKKELKSRLSKHSSRHREWAQYGVDKKRMDDVEMDFILNWPGFKNESTKTVVDIGSGIAPLASKICENKNINYLAVDGCPEILDLIDNPCVTPMVCELIEDEWPCYYHDDRLEFSVLWQPADLIIMSSIVHHLLRDNLSVENIMNKVKNIGNTVFIEFIHPTKDEHVSLWSNKGKFYPKSELEFEKQVQELGWNIIEKTDIHSPGTRWWYQLEYRN